MLNLFLPSRNLVNSNFALQESSSGIKWQWRTFWYQRGSFSKLQSRKERPQGKQINHILESLRAMSVLSTIFNLTQWNLISQRLYLFNELSISLKGFQYLNLGTSVAVWLYLPEQSYQIRVKSSILTFESKNLLHRIFAFARSIISRLRLFFFAFSHRELWSLKHKKICWSFARVAK